jgi:hypothetical protein
MSVAAFWLLFGQVPWTPIDFAPQVNLDRGQTAEISLELRRTPRPGTRLRTITERSDDGIRRLPWAEIDGRIIRYAVTATERGNHDLVTVFELVRDGRVRKRLRVRQRFIVLERLGEGDPESALRALSADSAEDLPWTRTRARASASAAWLKTWVQTVDDPRVPSVVATLAPRRVGEPSQVAAHRRSTEAKPLPSRSDAERDSTQPSAGEPSAGATVAGPTGAASTARAGASPAGAAGATVASPRARLAEARDAIRTLDLAAADTLLAAVEDDGGTTVGELARCLELRATVALLWQRRNLAVRLIQQATSLFPDLTSTSPIPWARARFLALRADLATSRPLAVGQILVQPTDGGTQIQVRFGPDPGRLIERVEVRFVAAPDALVGSVQHQGSDGIATLVSPIRPPDRQVALRIRLLDRIGRVLAEEGTQRPVYVPFARAESTSVRIPNWVWWTLGGVAVAGAATATILLVTDDGLPDPDRGIGPFRIDF